MPRRHAASFALVLALALPLALAPAVRAQVWNEVGDAGDLTATAQLTAGAGGLATLNGFLAGPTDADVYCVRLLSTPPASLPLVSIGCASHQSPNVYLFNSAGQGVATNYMCSGGLKQVIAPPYSLPPGNYYVAVSFADWEPQSAGGAIWVSNVMGPRVPDGPGGAGALTGWAGTPDVQVPNPYQLGFNSSFIGYCDAATGVSRPSWGALKIRYGVE